MSTILMVGSVFAVIAAVVGLLMIVSVINRLEPKDISGSGATAMLSIVQIILLFAILLFLFAHA